MDTAIPNQSNLSRLAWVPPAVTLVTLGVVHVSPIDPFTLLKASAILIVLAFLCLPWLFFKRTRLPFLLALITVIAGFFLMFFLQEHRQANVRSALEAHYDRIATIGPPFPTHLPSDVDLRPEGARCYYQRDADDVLVSFTLSARMVGCCAILIGNGWVLDTAPTVTLRTISRVRIQILADSLQFSDAPSAR